MHQQFNQYAVYKKFTCDSNIGKLHRRRRFAFCGTVRQTFEVLRTRTVTTMRHNAAFFNKSSVRKHVQDKMDKWMRDSLEEVRDGYPFGEHWILALRLSDGPFTIECEEDAVLKYLMSNISCDSPILNDVSQVLYRISNLPFGSKAATVLREFNHCIVCVRWTYEQRTANGWIEWCNTVAAEAIAATSFAVGWERTLKSITSGFAAGIAAAAPSRTAKRLLHFLDCVDKRLDETRRRHTLLNIAAHIALRRMGIASIDLRRMIVVPGDTRGSGMQLALMPRYLRLAAAAAV